MLALTTLTTIINLIALAASLWLGFYIITRSPYSAHSRLAALMLWSLDTYFLSNALWNNLHTTIWLAWMLQLALLALPLLLHLTVRLASDHARAHEQPRLHALNRVGVPFTYAFAVFLIACGVLPSSPPVGLFRDAAAPPFDPTQLGFVSTTASPFYALFLVFLISGSALALTNLWIARARVRHTSLEQPFAILFLATAIVGAGAAYSGFGTLLRLRVPTFPGDILYGISIFLVGYAVARYAALLEGRPMERDFLYALLLVGSLTAFYFVVVFVLFIAGQVSFVALVLTIIGTIAANSLFDAARIALDRFFYQSQFQKLRGNLRALAREVGSGGTLAERLHAVLASLCHLFRIRQGFIALNENNQWIVRATHQANPIGQSFDASALAATESIGLLHSEKKGLARMLLLIPLFAGSRQIGALVLGAQESQQPYTENDLALLEDLGDQIAALIHAAQAQAENARVIDALVQDFRERERALQLQMQEMLAAPERAPTAPDINVENLVPQVEDALRHLSDFAYLGEHPLAQLRVVEQRLRARSESALTFIERGKVVNEIIVQTLDSLRPAGVAPKKEQTPSREWHPFIILHDSYVEDEPNRDIMLRLAIGEGTFNRARRRALYGLAKSLAEIEQKTRAP